MKRLLQILVIALCPLFVGAQFLPRGLSDAEKQLIASGFLSSPKVVPGAITFRSPVDPPRSIAEWEELQAIVITWTQYQSILAEIVRHSVDEVEVLIVNRNETAVRDYLTNKGIDPDFNIGYIDAEYNSVWVRDYGGNSAYTGEVDSLVLVDWIYNRPRPADDLVPVAVAQHLGVPLLSTTEAPYDLVNTGGNYMTDGMGRAFSSNLVLNENGPQNLWGISNHSEAEVDAIMQQFLGIHEYAKMTVLPYDAIHHIDMHMKLIDEQTLVIGEYPPGVADGPQIEANLQYILEQYKTTSGRDYRVIRIPMPPDQFDRYPDQNGYYRTYANAMIINKTILVPVYEEQYDTTALRIWQDVMPGYKIVGIDCNDIIPASGALHCITKEVGVADPLWILHDQPMYVIADESAEIRAAIRHTSGIALASVYHRERGELDYTELIMERDQGNEWVAFLPEFESGKSIEYFICAIAQNGRKVVRPLPAPAGYFRLEVEASTVSASDPVLQITEMRVFPNPAHARTCVPVDVPVSTWMTLAVHDMQGRIVKTIFDGLKTAGESNYFFDAGMLSSGIYVLQLRTEHSRVTRKLVVD